MTTKLQNRGGFGNGFGGKGKGGSQSWDLPDLVCNSIDTLKLRLELGRKLRQGLRTLLGTHFLAVG